MSRSSVAGPSFGRQIAEIPQGAVAGALLNAAAMRLVWICLLLAGCSLYLEEHHKKPPVPPDGMVAECGPAPADAGACDCVYGQWRCNTCPWTSPEPLIACSSVGQTCDYEDWEHGCSCVCDASGYWSCTPETIGSYCPQPPYPDAAVYPDAAP
jgi:hypothetical protein